MHISIETYKHTQYMRNSYQDFKVSKSKYQDLISGVVTKIMRLGSVVIITKIIYSRYTMYMYE